MTSPNSGCHAAHDTISLNRVAAVFATMNRCETARQCVISLAQQSRGIDMLIVVDNASTDGTAISLRQLSSQLGLPCQILSLPDNLGNAGGIKVAMDLGFHQGFDAVWILDDDSWPEPLALEALLDKGPEDGIRTSTVLAYESDELSWPCEILDQRGHWRFATKEVDLFSTPYLRVRRSWLGALIPKSAYETVGPVNSELFLRGEDEDYPRRLEQAGYGFWMMSRSILRHPLSGKLITLSIRDHKISLEQDLHGDKLYYRIRNMLWLKKRECGLVVTSILAIGYLALILRWLRPLKPAILIFSQAAADASTGRLGKRGASKQMPVH